MDKDQKLIWEASQQIPTVTLPADTFDRIHSGIFIPTLLALGKEHTLVTGEKGDRLRRSAATDVDPRDIAAGAVLGGSKVEQICEVLEAHSPDGSVNMVSTRAEYFYVPAAGTANIYEVLEPEAKDEIYSLGQIYPPRLIFRTWKKLEMEIAQFINQGKTVDDYLGYRK